MEAVVAAVYLDGGSDAARDLVLRLLGDRIEEGAAGPGGSDFKTRLQEFSARAVRPAAALPGAGRGPRPLEALLRDRHVGESSTARGRGGRRSRPSRPPRAAWFALAGAADSALVGLAADAELVADLVTEDDAGAA